MKMLHGSNLKQKRVNFHWGTRTMRMMKKMMMRMKKMRIQMRLRQMKMKLRPRIPTWILTPTLNLTTTKSSLAIATTTMR